MEEDQLEPAFPKLEEAVRMSATHAENRVASHLETLLRLSGMAESLIVSLDRELT
jgi:hypothetical protein